MGPVIEIVGSLAFVRWYSSELMIARLFGMSKFSIHPPQARNNQNEAILLAMMRRLGILAPRYFFVDVRINDQMIGGGDGEER